MVLLLQIANNGWTHPDPIIATKEVIGPVTGGLALLLVFPAAIILGLRHFFSLNIGGKFICESYTTTTLTRR